MKASDRSLTIGEGSVSKKDLAKLAHGLEGITFDDMGFPIKVEHADPTKMGHIQTVTRFKVSRA